MRPPLKALVPAPPLAEGVGQGWFCLPILVSPPFSHMPESASESTAQRWPHSSTLLWQKLSGAGTFQLKQVDAFAFSKANQSNCLYSWKILFSFRGWRLSLIWKIAFSWGKSHVLGVHTEASREKRQAGRSDPGGFLKPIVPEGAIPALVLISLLINRWMIRNLCIRISGRRRTPFLERRQTALAYHQHRFCHRWVLSRPWFSSLHTSPP